MKRFLNLRNNCHNLLGFCWVLRTQAELIKICRVEAQRKLCEGKYQEALPAAQFSLRCAIDVHGLSDVQLIPAYLLLADANMGEEDAHSSAPPTPPSRTGLAVRVHLCVCVGAGNLPLVMELLSQAEWAVLKSSECTYEVRQWLHRSLGRLHAATGNLEKALLDFANDVGVMIRKHGGTGNDLNAQSYFNSNPFVFQSYSHCHLDTAHDVSTVVTDILCLRDLRRGQHCPQWWLLSHGGGVCQTGEDAYCLLLVLRGYISANLLWCKVFYGLRFDARAQNLPFLLIS